MPPQGGGDLNETYEEEEEEEGEGEGEEELDDEEDDDDPVRLTIRSSVFLPRIQ